MLFLFIWIYKKEKNFENGFASITFETTVESASTLPQGYY
jgi:hypothetical protein